MEILANAQRMDTNVGSAADPTTGHDSARPNEVVDVAAEHPIASEADRRPTLVRVAIEGHASTRLQTTLRHWYFRLSVWTASTMTKRSARQPSSR